MARRSSLLFLAMLLGFFAQPEARSQDSGMDESKSKNLVKELDAGREKLATVFHHDFVTDGLPLKFFSARNQDFNFLEQRPDGLVMRVYGRQKWTSTNLSLPFQVLGDFDVEASFTQWKGQGDKRTSVGITLAWDDNQNSISRIQRSRNADGQQTVRVSMIKMKDDGSRNGKYNRQECEATSGVLRISRRGDTIYHLVADEDLSEYRLIGQRTIAAESTLLDGIQLQAISDAGVGYSFGQVVWKDVRVAADKLLRLPPSETPAIGSLYVLTFADGTLKKIAAPITGMTQFGSAEWSGDGKTIVCDLSTKTTETSRIVRMNADGTGFQDFGPGCMPSLSPDGLQMVFSVPGSGVVKMNTDGSGTETIDASGWGTQWSPNGKYIAWGRRNNVNILNTQTDEITQLLTPVQQLKVSHVYWNLGWSHDSKSIAFKSRGQDGKHQLFVADIDTQNGFQLLHTAGYIEEDVSWLTDNKTVMFTTKSLGRSKRHFATISREPGAEVQIFSDIPEDWDIMNMDCSPDGKYLVFTGTPGQKPVEWKAK